MTQRLRPGVAASLVACGGFSGAIARYGVDLAVSSTLGATLLVNVLGSFLLALVATGWLSTNGFHRARRFAATGFLSSFTTYSTFVVGAVQSDLAVGVGYVLLTYAAGFGAAAAGLVLVGSLGGADR